MEIEERVGGSRGTTSCHDGGVLEGKKKFDTLGLIVFKNIFYLTVKQSVDYIDVTCYTYCIGFHIPESIIKIEPYFLHTPTSEFY